MSWHKVTIPGFTDSEARQTSAKELEELFKGKCAGALSPEGAALFTRMVPRDAGDSNDAEYYFTPEAMEFSEELVTKYDGQACTPECTPEADWKLSHIAGKTGDKYAHLLAWQRLAWKDDVADDARCGIYTFVTTTEKPQQLVIAEDIRRLANKAI